MKRILLLFVLLITVSVCAFAQTHTVTGKIMDETGKGYPGAAITVRGMSINTVTDENGDFMIEVPDGRNLFVVQATGYNTSEVTETDGTITVTLRAEAKILEGTATTAQDIKREKRELGYNNTTLSGEDLLSGGNNTSAITTLAGKVAGANITSSTSGPGGSSRIVLRGEKSIEKNCNALIVVDGVITNNYDRKQSMLGAPGNSFSEMAQIDFGNSGNDINPEEVESVTVLQGPAATVLYGAAGANGAIMYTMKKGKAVDPSKRSKMDITYKMSYTQSDVLKYASLQHEYGQGDIYGGVANDPSTNYSWGYKFDNAMRPWGQIIEGKQLSKPYSDQASNMKSFYNHGQNLNNYVAVSGGSEKSTYLFSINSLNSSGVIPNTFYNKYSVRFSGTQQLTNNFYTSVNMNYINTYSRVEAGGDASGSVQGALYQTPRDIPVWELSETKNPFYAMSYYGPSGAENYGFYNAKAKNPYWAAQYYDNRIKTDRVLGDFKVGYKKGEFNVFNRFGVDINSDRSFYKTPMLNSIPVDPSYTGMNQTSPGAYTQANYNGLRITNDLIGTFTHELSNNFGMTAILGHNTTIMRDETLAGIIDESNNGLVLPGFYNLQNNTAPVTGYNNRLDNRRVALFADIKFNYKRELFLELTGRNEWTSSVIIDRNSYFYPGVNAAWVFTERLNNTRFKEKVLNYGKLRMGASGVGNDAIAYANNASGYTPGSISSANGTINTPFNGIPVYQVSNTIGDKNLRPERTRAFEVGFDLSFLRDRISLSFTQYSNFTLNMISAIPVPASSGYQFNYTNVGDVSNNGQELAVRAVPISTRYGLKWELFGTYTHNVNKVVNLNGGADHIVLGGYNGMQIVAAEGKSYGTFYATEMQYVMIDGKAMPVVDQATGLPVATKTPVYSGSYLPKFQASWGTDLSYKGLKLHMLFTTKQGGVFYSQTKMLTDQNGTSEATTINGRNPYVLENSVYQVANTNIYLPNTTKMSPYAYYTATQQLMPAQGLVNASYVRLQEVSFSYKIPQRYYQRSAFGGLEAGVYGNNLVLWTAESNKYEDPEMTSAGAVGNGQGFNYLGRPSLRNYGAFIKVTF